MHNTLMQTTCKFCKNGVMRYNPSLSFHDYSLPDSFVLDDVDKIIDGIINEYLVYECDKCGSIEKLTYKEIERLERKRISQLVMNSIAKGEMRKILSTRQPRVLIYCNKCGGLDSKGSCLLKTYRNCKLKKLPIL